jgi:hypothetical protein
LWPGISKAALSSIYIRRGYMEAMAVIMFIWVASCFGLFALLKEDQKTKVINYVNRIGEDE